MPTQNHNSQKLLINELKKGNEKAFRKLFDMYWEPLFQRANKVIMDENAAKDVVQNVWIDIWLKRETRNYENFKAYIFKAVNNNCYKYFRDNKFDKLQLDIIDSLNFSLKAESNLEHDFEQTNYIVQKSLEELTPRCKQIYTLSRIENTSNDEIASLLGISKRSVENQISTALKTIKKKLALLGSVLLCLINHYH